MIAELMTVNPMITGVRILKADGGTMGLAESCVRPIETILSGPAASIMAARALSQHTDENIVVVDIGGTTTDIAVIVGGEALYQRNGAVIGRYQTLVPALHTVSIGLGGDSEIHMHDGRISLGPKRAGRAAALGGDHLTPTDAAVGLGLADLGSRVRAVEALKQKANGQFSSWEGLARAIVDAFAFQLAQAIQEVYLRLENVPVYTVSEILPPPDIRPKARRIGCSSGCVYTAGGQQAWLTMGSAALSCWCKQDWSCSSTATVATTLYVDTEEELMIIPELGVREQLRRGLLFDQNQARQTAIERTKAYAQKLGLSNCGQVQIVEEEAFNVVRGFHTVGRIFSIRAQIRPGVQRVR